MNLYPAASYLRHIFAARSTAGYGVHSPFMFDFLRNVIRGKTGTGIIRSVEGLRRDMLHDDRIIHMMDLGTGEDRDRRIKDIAGRDSLPPRYVSLLARMVSELRIKNYELIVADHDAKDIEQRGTGESGIILELGTSLGISTLALSLAAPETRVVTVEGCPQLADSAKENLDRLGSGNALVLNLEFDDALEKLRIEKTRLSFVFIDGNHIGEAMTHYVHTLRDMGGEMIIVADDIHLSSDMYRAWCSLAASDMAPVTLETFRFGVIFFLKKMTPGRYRIRY